MDDIIARLIKLETQVGRLVSDAESEKGTRRRSSEHFEHRLDVIEAGQHKTDRLVYMGMGGLAVLEIFLRLK